jgi:hypothetical protein
LFESQFQAINHGNYNPLIDICQNASWYRKSYFKKNIILYPETYLQYFLKSIKSIQNYKYYTNNVFYFYQYDLEYTNNYQDVRNET